MEAGGALSSLPVPRSVPNPDSPIPQDPSPPGLVAALAPAAALVYGLGHLTWYLGTPLGRVPVLDERENLDLAEAIAGGILQPVPFYRAPGYALSLACFRWLGVPEAGLFAAALLFGVALHAAGAWFAARLARRWFGPGAGVAAGLLYALNPVLVHFATQALDATLSLTLFMAGLDFLACAAQAPGRARGWLAASTAWAAAALARPNFLLAWLSLPVLALLQPVAARTRRVLLSAALAGTVLLAAAAAWQWRVSGVAGFMPWQGAYNLWAANRPGANGRYYTQHVSLPPELARANPARAESILLYEEETHGAPAEIPSMNAHWRARFVEEVFTHPLRWSGLTARKAYALFNNFEQYNNKTYAFHKALSPWLRWNPLCWGLLLALGAAGAALLAAERPADARMLGVVSVACTASILLFFVSARFRLSLVGILTALAGGAVARPGFWRGWPAGPRAALAAVVLAALSVAFSRFDGMADTATFVQDHVLLARAAFTVGDDATALAESNEALRLQPWHPDAQAIARAAAAEIAGKGATR